MELYLIARLIHMAETLNDVIDVIEESFPELLETKEWQEFKHGKRDDTTPAKPASLKNTSVMATVRAGA